MPNVQCPMFNVQCQAANAECRISNLKSQLPNAQSSDGARFGRPGPRSTRTDRPPANHHYTDRRPGCKKTTSESVPGAGRARSRRGREMPLRAHHKRLRRDCAFLRSIICMRTALSCASFVLQFELRWQHLPKPRDSPRFRQQAFPHSDDLPPLCAKRAVGPAIPTTVHGDLVCPEGNVALGGLVTMRTAMPKASVKKQRDLELRPAEIGCPRDRVMPSPSVDSEPAKQEGHLLLCADVTAGLDRSHVAGTSCLVHSIHRGGSDPSWNRFHKIGIISMKSGVLR
jgi:hypothetical protein